MAHHSLLKPRWFLLCPLLILLVMMAVACGGDVTPTPEPTSVPPPEATQPAAPTVAAVATAEPAPSGGIDPVALAAKFGETPKRGGKMLSVIFENIPHHDYQQGVGSNIQAQAPMYNTLLMTNPYDWTETIPDLAKSWELKDGGQQVVFHLEEGVKWHDGTALTSADVKLSLDRVFLKGKILGNETDGTFRNTTWVTVIDKIEAPDANTIVVTGKGASPLLLKIFADGYSAINFPAHFSDKDPLNALKEDLKPIGTGPFRLAKPVGTTLWEYERNPDYFKDGLPYLDAIDIHLILDIQTRATAVLTKQIYWSDPTPFPQLPLPIAEGISSQDPNIIHESFPTLLYNHFFMNTTRAPLDDVRVRQAISEALDRSAFTTERFGNQKGVVGTAVFPQGEWAMPKEMRDQLIGYGPDMEKRRANAKQLLASYEAEMGEIDWSKVPYLAFTQHISIENAQIAQALLKEIDVDLQIDPNETISGFQKITQAKDFYIGGFIGGVSFDDPTEFFGVNYITGARSQYHLRTTPGLDELFAQQKFETDPVKRKELVWEMDKLVTNDAGFLVIIWPNTEHLRQSFVKGWTPSPSSRNSNARMEFVWLDQ
jgi:peptide/nickel transport system substrate-binding protein